MAVTRVSSADFRALGKKRQPRVRNAQRTTVDGVTFDSKREAERWQQLRLQERAGAISNLRRQVPFALVVNRMLICQYFGDFVYERDGREVVEDAKGMRTETYRLKKKLMLAIYGIEIEES